MNTVTVLQGHVLDKLRELPENSVHCCISSPPYWGLRSYGTDDQIWDGEPGCEHVWGEEKTITRDRQHLKELGEKMGCLGGNKHSESSEKYNAKTGCFCQICSAWRGSYGLEPTIELYVQHTVEVFRAVRRVLRQDGVCFLNLGDSYSTLGVCKGGGIGSYKDKDGNKRTYIRSDYTKNQGVMKSGWATAPKSKRDMGMKNGRFTEKTPGLKPKDLCGIPWRVALALQAPYYTGVVKEEKDRMWLSALMDGEGCFGIRKQASSGNRNPEWNDSYIPYLTIKMSDRGPLDRAVKITGYGDVREDKSKVGEDSRKIVTRRVPYTWRLDGNKAVQLARELYPHLLVKQPQAALIHTLDLSNKEKKRGRGNTVPQSEIDYREQIYLTIKGFNQRELDVLPKWCEIPPSLFEPGWYLRSDIVWAKPNPMPESCTDRPTKSHEYIFLLTKSDKYFWDQEAVRENAKYGRSEWNYPEPQIHGGSSVYNASGAAGIHNVQRVKGTCTPGKGGTRNLRSVWNIATAPFAEAHFATFPPSLVEKCIKAGTSEKGVCPKCGKPWFRVVEKAKTFESGSGKSGNPIAGKNGSNCQGGGDTGDIRKGPCLNTKTLGWQPSCKCGGDPVPAVVCDIFGGSGTTALVAAKMGRDSIGVELKESYVEMAVKRIKKDLGFLVEIKVIK